MCSLRKNDQLEIVTLNQFGLWGFHHLDVVHPFLVQPHVLRAKSAILRALQNGSPFITPPIVQELVFHPAYAEAETYSTKTCGHGILALLGTLSWSGVESVPLPVFLEIMAFYLHWEKVRFNNTDGDWWLTSMPLLEKEGVRVQVKWPREPKINGTLSSNLREFF